MAEGLVHGGTDAAGIPLHDFSTNRNSCGPCPQVVAALQAAHVAQYPDPAYTDLRSALAAFHGVASQRVVVAGSASEFIHRITMHAVRNGAQCVSFPAHHYGDYPHAARNWGLRTMVRGTQVPGLHWACEPSSPLGLQEEVWPQWQELAPAGYWRVLDCAYAPLRLEEGAAFGRMLDHVWQMWTPNKALGLTGIRAAYAIAPLGTVPTEMNAIHSLAPSWVVGAHGVAMLQAWITPDVQDWLRQSLRTLQAWKKQQLQLCAQLGWAVQAGHQANYFVARWPADQVASMPQRLQSLRTQGIKLRDCTSFGLPGYVRLGVLPPDSQHALWRAWQTL